MSLCVSVTIWNLNEKMRSGEKYAASLPPRRRGGGAIEGNAAEPVPAKAGMMP
jgi:hypothetical protein